MRVWFVSTLVTEHMSFNDSEPGDGDYEYEDNYDDMFCSPLYTSLEAAVAERNRLFMDAYEKERWAHATRLKRHKARTEAIELLSLAGVNPEDLFPYGIGNEPEFTMPLTPRVGYLEVVEQ